jgi:hypothetical protein
MRRVSLLLALVAILFAVACGTGTSLNRGPQPQGNFSNASLKGQYAYQIVGSDTLADFREAGVFTADGNGNIISGTDDFAQGSTVLSDPSSGTYAISNDGTGTATLNFGNGGFISLAITMVSSSKVYLIVTQATNLQQTTVATGAGTAEIQNPAVLSAIPSGTFAFRLHTISSSQGSTGTVGAFTASGGVLTGNEDVNRGGAFSSLGLTGSLNAPDAAGRGAGTITDSNNVTSTFAYYVVDAKNLRFFSTDSGILGLGRAEAQTVASFSVTSLAGDYAFGSQGDTLGTTGGARTVGRFTAGGDGTISAGAFDSVVDGTPSANVSFTGTYTMDPSGRAVVSLNPTGGTVQEVFWMVSPSRAFFLVNDANKIEDGTVDLQQATSFSDSTMNGQFALLMDGFVLGADSFDRVGTLQWDGQGNLTLNEAVNVSGTPSLSGFVSGTYSVSSNGRATGIISNLSNNLVFYLISGSDGYVLQNDSSTEIDGTTSKQP